MARAPRSVEIRSYQVGFGDCFLLSFVYGPSDKRHVLIDFGTTELPVRGQPRAPAKASQHMPEVAKDIARVSEGRLTAVVATHRHADHISGFATDARTGKSGEIIAKLKPKVVIQPWTEDPRAARDARKATRDSSASRRGFIAGLGAMHDIAAVVADLAQRRASWFGPALAKQLRFLGEDNIRNASAVKNLIAMGKARGAVAVWARHGSTSGLERHLPGVKVHVLGPPDLTQTETIKTMRSKDPSEFWHLLAGRSGLRDGVPLAQGLNGGRRTAGVPAEARWFRERLERMQREQLLEIVRTLDDQMNNTSLILLFEVFGRKLLFPGDAQLENWSYALVDAPTRDRTQRLLAAVDVYKVGHHGSLNATPKTLLWERFAHRKGNGRRKPARVLTTLLSTLPGKHGSTQRKTEVPRTPLLKALEAETELFNTDTLSFAAKNTELCHTVEVKP